jgi:hypothetical protein
MMANKRENLRRIGAFLKYCIGIHLASQRRAGTGSQHAKCHSALRQPSTAD